MAKKDDWLTPEMWLVIMALGILLIGIAGHHGWLDGLQGAWHRWFP